MNDKKLTVTLQDTECDRYKRMFEAACVALGEIGDALGCDPNEGGSEQILDALEEMRSKLAEMEGNEAVAKIHVNHINGESSAILFNRRTLHHGDLLYAAAGATPYKDSTPTLSVGDSSFESWFESYSMEGVGVKQLCRDSYAAGMGDPMVIAASASTDSTKTVDKAWSQFCGGIGRGPDAPYPGMIEAFEAHYGQSFTDKDWRNETGIWAAAWGYATRHSTPPCKVEFHTESAPNEITASTR